MRRSRIAGGEGRYAPLLAVCGLVVAAVVSGCGSTAATTTKEVTVRQAPASVPAARPQPRLRRGEVQVPPGPFTDRVRFRTLRLVPGRRPHVVGSMLSRVDVSEVIVLELRADFYDAAGRRVGSGDVVFDDAKPFHDQPLRFTIVAHRASPSAVAARLTIPQLVNE